MRYLFMGNLASPYSIKCDNIIDAIDWFYMEADGIAVGFRPDYVLVRGVKIAHMRTIVRKDDGSLKDGIVYVVPSNGMRAIKSLFK